MLKQTMLKVLIIVSIGIMFISCDSSTKPETNEDPVLEDVIFQDEVLENIVRARINKPEGEIYNVDVDTIKTLIINNGNLCHLDGLEYFTGLYKLDVLSSMVLDLKPISGLNNLRVLAFEYGYLYDLSPLSKLENLTDLYLTFNRISDITPLAELENLTSVVLLHNSITDIKPLVDNKGFAQGDGVMLDGNNLNNVSVQTYVPQLKERGVSVSYSGED